MKIDLDFRPGSYGDFDGPVAAALNGIGGQMRREMVRDMLTAEGEQRAAYDAGLGPISDEVLEETASRAFTSSLSATHGPSWMGGEYLPASKAGEMEIARVVLASTTMDVFSIRARWRGGRYHYRIVDEYDTDIGMSRQTSMRPLTLRQLIQLIETAGGEGIDLGGDGLVRAWWNQQREYGDDPEKCTSFAWTESEIYPGLAEWYDLQAEEWRKR